jgi:hypothetical protein
MNLQTETLIVNGRNGFVSSMFMQKALGVVKNDGAIHIQFVRLGATALASLLRTPVSELFLSECYVNSDEPVELEPSSNPHLTNLFLGGLYLNSRAQLGGCLAAFPNLRSITLPRYADCESMLQPLAQTSRILSLDLSMCDKLSPSKCPHLPGVRTVTLGPNRRAKKAAWRKVFANAELIF